MVEKTEVQNDIRGIINWVVVFEEEYNLPKEVLDQLRVKLEDLSKKIDQL